MHRRSYNLRSLSLTQRVRSFVSHLIIGALLMPAVPAHAVRPEKPQTGFSAGGLMGLSGFRNLVMTIAMVNQAMRVAADNPMDEWRRTNVRTALGLMPGAIAGMAAHFANGQLGDGDLPGIQAMLGGFVDKNAGDLYKKFLVSPDKRLIPKTGANFPKVTPPPVPQGGAVASTSKAGSVSGGAQSGPIGKVAVDGMPNGQMVSNSQRREANKPQNTQSVGFDDGAAKGNNPGSTGAQASTGQVSRVAVDAAPTEIFGSNAGSGQAGTTSSSQTPIGRSPASVDAGSSEPAPKNRVGLPYVGSETVMEASREMSSIERRSPASATETPSTLTIIRSGDGQKAKGDLNDQEFFDNFEKDTKVSAKNKLLKKKGEIRRPVTKPTSWNRGTGHFLRLFTMGLNLLVNEAHAEGEEGDRSGGQAAAILMALAAMMAAIMPAIAAMNVAKTQADADKQIAKTNADAQVKMTEISADTQKQANQIAKDVALTQSDTAKQVAEMNNGAVTDRLQLQLAELRSARSEAQQAEAERRKLDENYNQQRIALAEKQSQENLDLAKQTLASQLSEAGLRQSFSNSTNSGDRLQTTTVQASAGTNSTRLATGLGNINSTGASLAAGNGLGTSAQATSGLSNTNLSALSRAGTESSGSADRSPASSSLSSLSIGNASTASTGQPRTSLSSLSLRGLKEGETTDPANEVDRFKTTTYSREAVDACKGIKDPVASKACLEKYAASSRRGFKVSPTRERLTKGPLATNTNQARGLASRLTMAMSPGVIGSTPTNLQTGTQPASASSKDSLAFRGDAPSLNKGSSFGDFVSKRGATSPDFISYRAQSGGVANRERAKADAPISGGHARQGESRGLRGLIDE